MVTCANAERPAFGVALRIGPSRPVDGLRNALRPAYKDETYNACAAEGRVLPALNLAVRYHEPRTMRLLRGR